MGGYLLGLYEKSMPNSLTIKEKLNEAKNAGFDFMEISIDESDEKLGRLKWDRDKRLEVVNATWETGVKILTMCLSGHRKFPIGSEDMSIRERGMEIMSDAIDFATDIGIRVIQIAGYDEYYKPSNVNTKKLFIENLKKCTEMAAGKGVILAFETMETEFMNTVEKAMVSVNEVNSPYLQVYPDLGNITNAAIMYNRTVSEDILSGKGHIAAMHLKETVPGKFREIPFGTGHVNFSDAIKIAHDIGVSLFVGEFWYVGNEDWQMQLEFANSFLRQRLDHVFIRKKHTTSYYMGIDNGGTLCKAVIFDKEGKEIASASTGIELLTPHAGFTERNMDDLWKANCGVIREAIDKAGIDSKDIKGIACTGHGKGLYLWGKDDMPCYNGIVSTDGRAWMYPEKWNTDGTADRVFKKTCQKILACQPVSLLRWLKDNEPGVIENIKWIFEVKDYIRFKLTNQAFAEKTDYSGSNLMNIKDVCFDKELLKEYGLEDVYDALPPLKSSTDVCGTVSRTASKETGLAEGTLVAGGMFDIDACAIAMDITNEENIAVIAGTWSINEYISKEPVLDRSIMMNSLYCIDGYYLIEECSPTSAGNHEWFTSMFLGEEKRKAREQGVNVYKYCDEMAAEVLPDEQNIVFLPFLFGSNYNPQAKATIIGLDSHHTKAQIIRAVLEGIAFCHKVHMEKLLANRKSTRAVRLAGGAAGSMLWAQIFSDVFNLPVEIIDTRELGALGCAMAAAVASGEYKDLGEAAKSMVKVKCRLEPQAGNVAIYEKKYELYKKVEGSLESLWKEFAV